MTVRMETDGKRITLEAPQTATARVKEIPGARYDSKARAWRFPLSWAVCVVARGVFGSELEVGPALAAWARNELETRINPALEARRST